mgnify:CR=1 FL=1
MIKVRIPTPLRPLTKNQGEVEAKAANIGEMIEKARDARKELSIEMLEPAHDPVNHPAHYKVGGIETIDFIEAKGLSYHLGNVVKYITRADHKSNKYEDLCKARWYLNREIAKHSPATT